MWLAEKFKKRESRGPVVDLDAIIEDTNYVKFMGKTHEIKPIMVSEFFALANSWASVELLKKQDKVTVDNVVDAYHAVIFPVCPTISKDMIRKASAAQLAALVQFITDIMNGRMTEEKKKKLLSPMELNLSE